MVARVTLAEIDVVRRNQILRAEHELLQGEQNADLLRELERQNAELEARIPANANENRPIRQSIGQPASTRKVWF